MSTTPLPLFDDNPWREEAACLDDPPERFLDPADPNEKREALKTCANCNVRSECLEQALGHSDHSDIGIWGGTTEATRRRIRHGSLTIKDAEERLEAALKPRKPGPDELKRLALRRERKAEVTPLPEPEVTVALDPNGDYVSADGRTVIFRATGDDPWMLLIDERPVTRTATLTEARRIAWTRLNESPRETQLDKVLPVSRR